MDLRHVIQRKDRKAAKMIFVTARDELCVFAVFALDCLHWLTYLGGQNQDYVPTCGGPNNCDCTSLQCELPVLGLSVTK